MLDMHVDGLSPAGHRLYVIPCKAHVLGKVKGVGLQFGRCRGIDVLGGKIGLEGDHSVAEVRFGSNVKGSNREFLVLHKGHSRQNGNNRYDHHKVDQGKSSRLL